MDFLTIADEGGGHRKGLNNTFLSSKSHRMCSIAGEEEKTPNVDWKKIERRRGGGKKMREGGRNY